MKISKKSLIKIIKEEVSRVALLKEDKRLTIFGELVAELQKENPTWDEARAAKTAEATMKGERTGRGILLNQLRAKHGLSPMPKRVPVYDRDENVSFEVPEISWE